MVMIKAMFLFCIPMKPDYEPLLVPFLVRVSSDYCQKRKHKITHFILLHMQIPF